MTTATFPVTFDPTKHWVGAGLTFYFGEQGPTSYTFTPSGGAKSSGAADNSFNQTGPYRNATGGGQVSGHAEAGGTSTVEGRGGAVLSGSATALFLQPRKYYDYMVGGLQISGSSPVSTAWIFFNVAANGAVASGSATIETVSGAKTLAGELPAITSTIESVGAAGNLSGSLPKPTSSMTGLIGASGVLGGTLPVVNGALAGGFAPRFDAELPAITGTLTAQGANAARLNSVLPVVQASFTGTAARAGTLRGRLKRVRGSFTAACSNAAVLNSNLRHVKCSFTAKSTLEATLSSELQPVTGAFAAYIIRAATLNSRLRAVRGAFK